MSATSINATIVRALLTMRATVYTRATNGQFTVVAQSGVACLLMSVSSNGATSVADRAALAAQRVLQYDATYSLPASGVQVEVDAFPGQRWNPQAGTDDTNYFPGIGVAGKSVLCVRAS